MLDLAVLVDAGLAEIAVSEVGVLGPAAVLAHQSGDDGQLVQRPVPPERPAGEPGRKQRVYLARGLAGPRLEQGKTSAFDTLSNVACGPGWTASAPSSNAPS